MSGNFDTGRVQESPDLRLLARALTLSMAYLAYLAYLALFSLFSSIVRYTIASPPTEFRKLITNPS